MKYLPKGFSENPCQKDTCEVSGLSKFANGEVFQGSEDKERQNTVKDLKETEKPDNNWLVKFHLDKCKVMHTQRKFHKTPHRK